jgi:tRNA-2-methylthio-N6-dimethylallyladenosine synthase
MPEPRSPSPKVHIKTYGCQMNELDSGKMLRLLELDGWTKAEQPADADALLINTCTVREKPAHKVMSLLGRYREIKQQRPSVRIVVTGCYAVQEGRKLLRSHPEVDAVVGPDAVTRIADVLRRTASRRFVDMGDGDGFAEEPVFRGSHTITAMVAIQRGCDHGCTYCIVPSVRGDERYRPAQDVLREVDLLVAAGARDVTLLGQNVNRFRGVADDGTETRFAALLDRVARDHEAVRIRFLTSNPWDFGDDTIEVLSRRTNVCPYLHLPVQSGSDGVLERMGRPHTARDYLDRVGRIRAARPEVCFSTDILVGFPGETEDDFERTLELVREVRYSQLFVFAYSPRPGTVASEWPDDVPREVKVERLMRVLDAQESITRAHLEARVGTEVRVLLDEVGRDSLMGRTLDFTLVHVEAPESWLGREVPVHIDRALRHTLWGTSTG